MTLAPTPTTETPEALPDPPLPPSSARLPRIRLTLVWMGGRFALLLTLEAVEDDR